MRAGGWLALVVATGTTACTEPTVQMTLATPNTTATLADTSCTTSIEVYADGGNYPSDQKDWARDCVQVPSGLSSYDAVRAAIRGKVQLKIPSSGLSGLEIFGRMGSCDNQSLNANNFESDLIFYGSTPYHGEDTITIPVVPNLGCAHHPITIRPVELMTLTTTKSCAMAALADTKDSGAAIGTLAPTLEGPIFNGGFDYPTLTSGAATIDAMTNVGPKSCLATRAGNQGLVATSCALATPPVCARAGELEAPVIDYNVFSASIDQALIAKFPDVIVGAVWKNNGTANAPLAGATVTIDASVGKVFYVEPNAGKLAPTLGTMTGQSGMFLLYTNQLVDAQIVGAGITKTVRLGGWLHDPSAALVLLQ